MVFKKLLQAVGFSLCFATAYANNETAEIKPSVLKPVRMSKAELANICRQIRNDCKGEEHYLYQSDNGGYYYINDVPQFVTLNKTDSGYEVDTMWYFGDYKQNKNQEKSYSHSQEELSYAGLKIHPAFYPIHDDDSVIALKRTFYKPLSEGESVSEIVDFIDLKHYGEYEVVLENIPFYQYEKKRACFNAEDYKNSPHCYDEFSRILQIKFHRNEPAADNNAQSPSIYENNFKWELLYTDKIWPAHQAKSEQKVIHKPSLFVSPYQKAILEWPTEDGAQ